ncbi:hypothetical protein PO909_022605 [Leuciscus waleckii]
MAIGEAPAFFTARAAVLSGTGPCDEGCEKFAEMFHSTMVRAVRYRSFSTVFLMNGKFSHVRLIGNLYLGVNLKPSLMEVCFCVCVTSLSLTEWFQTSFAQRSRAWDYMSSVCVVMIGF